MNLGEPVKKAKAVFTLHLPPHCQISGVAGTTPLGSGLGFGFSSL